MSLCIVNVADTERGKTTRAIEIAKGLKLNNIIVNDKQHEYKYRIEKSITKYYGSNEGYISLLNKYDVKGAKTAFIIEEAASLLPHGGQNSAVTTPILSKRFNGNVYILNFHALQQVPEYIMHYVDLFVIGYCAGNTPALKRKYMNYPHILEAWQKMQKPPKPWSALYVWK